MVLPFVNMSGDAEQEYFADGITEDIIAQLSRFRSIFVIASNSSFHYKGRSPKVQDVGRELGVEYVVEGSVRKAANRVRITAQLVEAASGAHLWAERYDRDLDDIFAVQDEVAAEIVTAVPGQVDLANKAQGDLKPAKDLTAYDLLLRAEAISSRDWTSLEALELFEQAVKADPSYARAHSRLSVHLGYQVFSHGLHVEETWRRVRQHTQTALELDPNDAVVQAAATEAFILLGEHDLAKRHADKALSLNPNDINVIIFAGINHSYLGDYEEGLKWVDLALRRDPYAGDAIRESIFDCYLLAGEYEKAIAQLPGWHNPPPHMWVAVAVCYALLGKPEEARKAAARYKSLSPDGWANADIRHAHLGMLAKQEDRDRFQDGYKIAGVPI